ncbi:YchJ family protein [Deinococcus maricopensis]|uniref:YchJ family protein n=1 Tax=Deinococcus maricopensis TaxID=309887 RepID=UPI0024793F61|nr:YchJ family metal-binding protein [Deinococcus maricopensis]
MMRSRYSAYVLNIEPYIRASWHPDTCPEDLLLNDGTKWLSLKITGTEAGGPDDERGTVSFDAMYHLHGRKRRLRERSEFTRLNGAWVYVDGVIS